MMSTFVSTRTFDGHYGAKSGFWGRLLCTFGPFVLTTAIVFITYWQTISSPFVQDDWAILYNNAFGRIDWSAIFLPNSSSLFYRPLGYVWFRIVWAFFGTNAVPNHIIMLLVLAGSASCIVLIARRLFGNSVSWMAGPLYAAGSGVHIFPQLWLVGIYDIAGVFFMLLSFVLYLSRRTWWSIGAFVAALLFKEAVIVFPVLLLGYELIMCPSDTLAEYSSWLRRRWESARVAFLRTWPFLAVMAFYGLASLRKEGSSFSLPADHPYVLRGWGSHVSSNIYAYLRWSLQGFLPSVQLSERIFTVLGRVYVWLPIIFATGIFLVVVLVIQYGKDRTEAARALRVPGFCVFWFALGLVPVVFLTNHTYSYYLSVSFPGLALLATWALMQLVRIVPRRAHGGPNWRTVICGAMVTLVVVANLVAVWRVRASVESSATRALVNAGSVPFALGESAMRVNTALDAWSVDPPKGAVFIYEDVNAVPLLWGYGLAVRYGDPTITAYRSEDLQRSGDGFVVDTDEVALRAAQGTWIDADKVFVIRPVEPGSRTVIVEPFVSVKS